MTLGRQVRVFFKYIVNFIFEVVTACVRILLNIFIFRAKTSGSHLFLHKMYALLIEKHWYTIFKDIYDK